MPSEASMSDLDDPTHSHSFRSLFPRTCRNLAGVSKPGELNDLDSVHSLLQAMELKEPGRHIEQARIVMEISSGIMLSDDVTDAGNKENAGAVGGIKENNERKRRPGLDRKKAKFNINGRVSQPTVIKDPVLDISTLDDPEEFFRAHERHENAKKELRKQSGILMELDIEDNINELSATVRHRRPGIPGRAKATYTHHCYPDASYNVWFNDSSMEDTEKVHLSPSSLLISAKETPKLNESPDGRRTHQEVTDPINRSMDGVFIGSLSKENEFLDEILAGAYDHLNADGQLELLQEKLQCEPRVIDKLNIPKMPDYPKSSSGNLFQSRNLLPDRQIIVTGINTKTPVRTTHAPSSVQLSASPTPSRSAFAHLSSLRRQITLSNKSKDPFLDVNADQCPAGSSSALVTNTDKQSDSAVPHEDSSFKFDVYACDEDLSLALSKSSRDKDSGSLMFVPDRVDAIKTEISNVERSSDSLGGLVQENGNFVEPQRSPHSRTGSQIQSEEETQEMNSLSPIANIGDQHSSPDTRLHGKQTEFQSIGPERNKHIVSMAKHTKQKNGSLDKQNKKGLSSRKSITGADTEAQENEPSSSEMQATEAKQKMSFTQPDTCTDDQCRSSSAKIHDKQTDQPNIDPEQYEQELPNDNTRKTLLDKKRKGKSIQNQEQNYGTEDVVNPRKKQKKKEVSLRKSIAVAGTYFESGVRRSTRIKSRPLEFWRGERFLYARVERESTLRTVIGIKFASPLAKAKANPVLKVKPYIDVKDQKNLKLVEQAAGSDYILVD